MYSFKPPSPTTLLQKKKNYTHRKNEVSYQLCQAYTFTGIAPADMLFFCSTYNCKILFL